MALLNSKKTRPQRAPTIASSSLSGRLRETLRNRNVLPRLLLCLCAVVGMLFAVEGWRASFPYRLGGRATHGIAAQVAFDRVNEFETERLRRQRAEQMPYLFEYDPEPLRSLPAKLRSNLGDMDEAETFEALSLETRNAFGLGTSVLEGGNSTLTPDNMDQQFATLKAALSAGGGSSGKRIDEIVDDFKQFLRAVEPYGIVSSDELEANAIAADRTIAIVSPSGGEPRTAIAGKAQLTELLKDTGLLGKWWGDYPRLVEIRPMLQQWLIAQSPVTLHYLATKTQASQDDAMASVDAVKVSYHRGEVLVKPGQVIDEELLSILQEEYNAIEDSIPLKQRLVRVGTVSLMFTVLAVLYGYYLVRNEQQLVNSAARLAIYLGVVVLAVALGRALSFESWRAEVIPLLATTMVFAIAYDQVFATLTAFMLALIITISTVAELGQFVVLMSVATTAVIPLRRVPSRSTLIKVGFLTGAVYFVVSWGTGIIRSQSPSEIWTNTALLWSSLQGAFCCLVAGYLVAGSLPFIESAFGVVTDISLLEMGDISHPLLHELVHRAPGTYNHSITVAAIGEAAADSIGANGLLVRVGAYFHDIGKMLKPQYFVENVTEGSESRHEHLAPAMSTLIIIGHVKDGVDLGRQHSLPQRLIDFIEQHHGTTLVEYFYHEATKQADRQPDHKTDAEESSFRYPGPKPQSRETGVLMLADAVESASRTLSEPTPKRIERLVHDLTLKRLLDGQFDECSLTLSEIRTIEESLVKSLIGIYHGRIKYPEQRTA